MILKRTRILASLVKFIPFHDYSMNDSFFISSSKVTYFCLLFYQQTLNVSLQEAVIDIKLPRRSLLIEFTCNACGARSQKFINRLAYERGTVFVQVFIIFRFKVTFFIPLDLETGGIFLISYMYFIYYIHIFLFLHIYLCVFITFFYEVIH